MGLSGSQIAYKQARAGIERAGASRAGYYTYNPVLTINGVDRSTALITASIRLTQALNDEADTLSFSMKPGFPIPVPDQRVFFSLGSSANRQFGGVVIEVTHERRHGISVPSPFIPEAENFTCATKVITKSGWSIPTASRWK